MVTETLLSKYLPSGTNRVEVQDASSTIQVIQTIYVAQKYLRLRDRCRILNFHKNKQSFWFTNHSDLLFLQNRM